MPMPRTLVWLSVMILASASSLAGGPNSAREGEVTRSDLEIVECLLPGQVRQLGSTTYLTPRRPVRTTASDCRIRGGEYVAYDRADMKSALRIWMATAQSGDPEAQNNVGEIYERGVGGEPDYEAAALWYQKAAAQNYSRAQVNLGLLYEQGLGVTRDRVKALNLYRQAAGVPENSVIYADAAQREEEALRAQLEQSIAEKDAELSALRKQVEELEEKVRKSSGGAATGAASPSPEVNALRSLVKQLEQEKAKSEEQLAQAKSEEHLAVTARTRAPTAAKTIEPLDPQAAIRSVQGQNMGRYYALVIANQDYRKLEKLATPRTDASRVSQLLHDKYGFTVQTLDDVDDITIMTALNDLSKVLRPEDNLLIYYAGHGWRLKAGVGDVGYWLPVNAEKPPDDTFWVPNEQVSAHIGRLVAKRVLVVADSCYAGLLSNDPGANLFGASGAVSAEYLKYEMPKRSRLLIASGGDQPVLDTGGGGDSVFARAFIDVLQQNDGVLSAPALFARLRDRVKAAAAHDSFAQIPELKSIRSAGHEMGDFFFVPVKGS